MLHAQDMQPVALRASRHVHDGHVIKVTVDTVQLPNNRTIDLDLVHHPGAAAVVPVTAEGDVVLVRQYRYATGDFLLEIPAGKRDGDEAPEACAARELEEETGFRAGALTPLGFVWTSPGFCDERIWLFLATELVASAQALEPDEVLSVVRMPLAEAVRRAGSGEITDGKSVAGLLRAQMHLGRLG